MITFSYKINTQPQTSNSNTGYEDIHAKEEVDDLVKRLLLKTASRTANQYDGTDLPGRLYDSDR